jgi:hypothetical protein
MNRVLRIAEWDKHFETHDSRKLKRLTWVSIPNDVGDVRYRILVDHQDGAAHFGAWVTIVEIASICKERGVLIDGGVSLTARHLSLKSGIPEQVFAAAIPRLVELGWLEESPDVPAESPDVPGKTSAYRDRDRDRDIDITETKNTCASGDARLSGPASDLSIDNPPFDTTEPGALFPPGPQRAPKKPSGMTPEQEGWFTAWWSGYWLHRAKKPARLAFAKCVKTTARFDEVMAATRAQSAEMLAREPQHRPHGATWLNGERWADEAAVPKHDASQDALARMIYGEEK